ncbi:MAG: hypothetical protein IJE53_02985 [Bacilli bacterium]|nr:hypothetical protein [Bacilli bacterium]
MSLRFTENGIRKGLALILVGTIAGSAYYGQVVSVEGNSDFLKGYYYDEDVKKNRDDLMKSIELGGSTKTYEKKRDLCPKTIKK